MLLFEKRTSWLELFYDLAFIALVAQLTYLAATHHGSITDYLNVFLVGYTIFIAWWATTANRNLQPQETSTDKFFVQLQMVGVFLMSITMAQVFEGQYLWFFLTLSLVRLLQSFMIIRMYYLHPETRPVTYNILEGFFAASALWALSAFLPDPYHFIVAFMALATDIFVPLTRGQGNTRRYLNVYHLQERLGLFLMLVMGESMIVVALANSVSDNATEQLSLVFSGLAVMIALWWLYFEHSDRYAGKRPRDLFGFLHAHAFLFGSIIVMSAGYKRLLEQGVYADAYTFVLVGMLGIAATILAIRYSLHSVQIRVCLWLAMFAIVALAFVGAGYLTGQYLVAIMCLTGLLGIIAVLDQRQVFLVQPVSRQSEDTIDKNGLMDNITN